MEVNENIYHMYEMFIMERHRIWERRQAGQKAPWTNDPMLWKKYTNAFRVLDHGSQYMVRMLQEPGLRPEDALARAFLYRYTNRPEAWDAMKEVLGRWPLASDMTGELADGLVYLRETVGVQIFSGAYIIMPAPNTVGDKVRHAVALAHRLMHPESPENVVQQVVGAATPAQAFAALKAHHGVGDFMAMQVLTDWGYYWPDWDENAFVIAGPGSKKGIDWLEPTKGGKYSDVIKFAQDRWYQRAEQPLIPLSEDRARPLSLMDVQNTFCEFSKYMRALKKEAIPLRGYVPAHPGAHPVDLPRHWR